MWILSVCSFSYIPMGLYNHAYCTGKSSPDSRKQPVVKQLPFAIVYWAGFSSQLGKEKNQTQNNIHNTKPTPNQKSFEDRIWEVLFIISHSTSSSSWLWQAQAVCSLPVSPALIPPGCLVPVNLYCQESLAWGSIGHLGINYERRSNALQMKAVSHSTSAFSKPLKNSPQDQEEATELTP